MNTALAPSRPEPAPGARPSLCFVVDTDFGYLQGFSRSLRGLGVTPVEFVNSVRLGENVDNHNPDIVFISLDAADPYDCVRALFSLKECKFAGRVQLYGRCVPAFLESFRKIGTDAGLTMLPALQKPIDFAAVRRIVQGQQLKTEPVSPPELSLKKAMTSNWIVFLYQPQLDLQTKKIVGAEAFVRVSHPRHGILPPARFMGGASEEELAALASQAITNAVKMSAALFKLGVRLKISVNVNVETLSKLPVAILVEKYRPQDDQWPGLVFEVAESQALTKSALLKSRIVGLHQAGVTLALDNCGRGNSSFAIFKELPFSEIKMDRSFVNGCAADKGSANVCESIIKLAHAFGSKAAAVGIESNEEAQHLLSLGCDVGQGYLFAKPMTEEGLMGKVMTVRAESSAGTADASPRQEDR
jgi:EAL domain-containing protein (putative c-di-GMP-specific phosphodiesterase class I)